MQQPTLFWDKIADKYARKPIGDLDAYNRTLARTRSYLHKSDRVLELGCGTGTTALSLAGSVGEYVASDFSPNMIQVAEDKMALEATANLQFLVADVFDPALEDGYDAVLAFNLLHLLEDLSPAVRRVQNLLKPGGVFISKTALSEEKS